MEELEPIISPRRKKKGVRNSDSLCWGGGGDAQLTPVRGGGKISPILEKGKENGR